MTDKINHKKFFEHFGKYGFTINYYEIDQWISIDELYQYFKAKFLKDMLDKEIIYNSKPEAVGE